MVNIKVAAGFVVAALLLGLVAGTALAGDDENRSETKEAAGGLLVSDRTKLGAVTAAANYAEALGNAIVATRGERESLVKAISSREMARGHHRSA